MQLLLGGLRALGSSTCPTPAEVRVAIAEQFGPEALSGPDDLAVLEAGPNGVRLRLFDAESQLQGDRLFPSARGDQGVPNGASSSCTALARAAATVIVAWRGQPVRASEPEATRLPEHSEVLAERPVGASSAWALALGLGAGLVAGSSLGTSEWLEGSIGPVDSPWSLVLRPRFETPRTLALGVGEAQWRRLAVGVGGALRLMQLKHLSLAVEAELVPDALEVQGLGFAQNFRTWRAELGVAASLRGSLRLGWLSPWVELEAMGWPSAFSAVTADRQTRASLPALDLIGALGVDLETGLRIH